MPLINKTRTHSVVPGREFVGLRVAITAFFALDGFIFSGWVVRIPDIKHQTHASAGALGLALLGVSAGAVLTMMLTGRLCRRYGSHPVTVVWMVVLALSVALPPLTRSALALGAVLLVFGAAYGGVNVAFNAAAVDLVAAVRRPIMPGFHAAFSLGGMVGAGVGGLVAAHLSPTRHLLGITVLGLLVTAVAGRSLLRHEPPVPPGDDREPMAAGTGRAARVAGRWLVVGFGLVALCDAYGEGAMADWGALHLRQDLTASTGTAAAGYACFALAMTAGRLSGTALLGRLGRARTVIAGGSVAAVGMLLGSLAPSVWAALAGFAVTGLGLANIFPVAIERAGALAGASGVAIASTLGYGGMLLGPPMIGFMTDWFSLPTALTSVAALAAVAALIGVATRRALNG
ncbi:MFS transporter [Streptomyces sp. WP-1]|uniref:MFS transporter n=1 Tax=Streptomyces sp. WP-1 TaxID=3041497 RepID=UPI002649D769|nr:MFS transporter [Streptomyces sp. WP-1]WKE73117.1 MFS transporter [Streptomyces sp. WP-1]